MVKVLGWYDNEWGYSNRLVDLTTPVVGDPPHDAFCRRPHRRGRLRPARPRAHRPERPAGQEHGLDHRRRPDPASLPTLQALRARRAPGDRGRPPRPPRGRARPQFSLAPVAARLGELLGTTVPLAADVAGQDARAEAESIAERGRPSFSRTYSLRGLERPRRTTPPAVTRRPGWPRSPISTSTTPSVRCTQAASVFEVCGAPAAAAGRLVARELRC